MFSEKKQALVVRFPLLAAKKGTAVRYEGLKYMMGRIAADGRNGYSRGVLSSEALSSFRERY